MDNRQREKPVAQDFAESVAGYEAWRKDEIEKGAALTAQSEIEQGDVPVPGRSGPGDGNNASRPRAAGMRDGIGSDPPAWHSASCSYPDVGCTCRAWATGPYFG